MDCPHYVYGSFGGVLVGGMGWRAALVSIFIYMVSIIIIVSLAQDEWLSAVDNDWMLVRSN